MFFRVSFDARLDSWTEVAGVVEAKNHQEALEKGKKMDMLDMKLSEPYEFELAEIDEAEGITIEEIL